MTQGATSALADPVDLVAAPGCQRWRRRRASYRPPGEPFEPRRHSVELIEESVARSFVVTHHYAGSFPAARRRVGLFRSTPYSRAELVGVAVFSVPITNQVVPHYFPALPSSAGVELGRLVLLDHVEANAESWFCARAFRLARAELGVRGTLAYCDPMPRFDVDGREVKKGHVGTVYRALGARFAGRSSPRTLLLAPSGRVISPRALSKLRLGETGAGYAERQLVAEGLSKRHPFEEPRAYILRLQRDGELRPQRHPGNLVFCWDFR